MASTAGGNLFRSMPVPWGLKASPWPASKRDQGEVFREPDRARSAALPGGARESLGKSRAVLRNLGLSRNNISPARLFGARGQVARDLQVRKGC